MARSQEDRNSGMLVFLPNVGPMDIHYYAGSSIRSSSTQAEGLNTVAFSPMIFTHSLSVRNVKEDGEMSLQKEKK